jgi:ribosomal protein S18 acetylase RimI-like enzyme
VKTFNFYFNNKKNAVKRIEKIINARNNCYGHEKIYVVNEGNQVYGVLVTSTSEEEDIINDFKVYLRTLSLKDTIKFILLEIVDWIFLAKLKGHDYYLSAVAVAIGCRGKGIGTFIVKKSLKLAREKGCKRVVLDVDQDNTSALNLYKRF